MAGITRVTGYEPSDCDTSVYQQQLSRQQQSDGAYTNQSVQQLFKRLSEEIEENQPKNCIHFTVDFLCKHYPEHLHGFASIWQMDPDLELDRHEVVNFFKAHKISTAVAAHFANAGYDTLDTLTTLSPDSLVDIEAFNNVKWLPGHKVRLQQVFAEISARVKAYREQYRKGGGARVSPAAHRRHSPAQRHHSPVHHPVTNPSAHRHTLHHPVHRLPHESLGHNGLGNDLYNRMDGALARPDLGLGMAQAPALSHAYPAAQGLQPPVLGLPGLGAVGAMARDTGAMAAMGAGAGALATQYPPTISAPGGQHYSTQYYGS